MFYPVIFVLFLITFVSGQTLSPRIVRTKQGSVKGVLVIPSNRDLQPVEAFLGLPFAAPPVGPLRFMPPVTPLPWNGVRLMDKYGPACPQTLPDVSNEKEALRFVTRGRLQYLRRLLPYLRNQSEDCLYLNIYAPVTGTFSLFLSKFILKNRWWAETQEKRTANVDTTNNIGPTQKITCFKSTTTALHIIHTGLDKQLCCRRDQRVNFLSGSYNTGRQGLVERFIDDRYYMA